MLGAAGVQIDGTVVRLVLAASLGYVGSYAWRSPWIGVIPADYAERKVLSIDFQTFTSLCYCIGFALGKPIGISLFSSKWGASNKTKLIIGLQILSGTLCSLGLILFDAEAGLLIRSSALAAITSAGLASVASSTIYGGYTMYLEGRRSTALLLAFLNFSYVFAGGMWRWVGAALIDSSVPARYMPAAMCAIGMPVSCVAVCFLGSTPPPLAHERELKGRRGAMSFEARIRFLWTSLFGISIMFIQHSALATMRSFRDSYFRELVTHGTQLNSSAIVPSPSPLPSSFVPVVPRPSPSPPASGSPSTSPVSYLLLDLPGGLAMFFIMIYLGSKKSIVLNPRSALLSFFAAQACGVAILLVGTAGYGLGLISEVPWQVLCGLGIYASYGTMGAPTFDALFAVTRAEGTSSFLIFAADGVGYVGTISVLLLKDFGVKGGGSGLSRSAVVEHDKGVFTVLALIW